MSSFRRRWKSGRGFLLTDNLSINRVSMEEGVWDTCLDARLESTQVTVRHWWDFTWNKKFICLTMQAEINTRHVKRSDGNPDLPICILHSVPDKHHSSLIFLNKKEVLSCRKHLMLLWIKGPGKTRDLYQQHNDCPNTDFTMWLSFISSRKHHIL